MAASSTLELVEKLKAQLAESREDLFRKERVLEDRSEVGSRAPKESPGSIMRTAGPSESAFSDDRDREKAAADFQDEVLASFREELRQHSSELTTKMHSLASNTRQLSQQLLREREDRLAFQQEVCLRLGELVHTDAPRPKVPGEALLESSVVALREDLEHLSGQFLLLQEELKASFESMAMQLGAVVGWVHEKLDDIGQPGLKDGVCLSPILEDRGEDSPAAAQMATTATTAIMPELMGLEQGREPGDGKMFQVLRNIADEMPAIVKQMAEKTQILVTRVEHEHAERLAREAHVEQVLSNLTQKVEDALGRGRVDEEHVAVRRPSSHVQSVASPVLLSSFQVRRRLNGQVKAGAQDFHFEAAGPRWGEPTLPTRSMLMEKTLAQAQGANAAPGDCSM